MLEESSYDFTMQPGTRTFYIVCTTRQRITTLQPGWNMVSSPSMENVTKKDLRIFFNGTWYTWQEAVDNHIVMPHLYYWDGTAYQIAEQLEPGKGYWLYAYESCELWTEVYRPGEGYIAELLEEKWNLIGFPCNQTINIHSIWVLYNGTWHDWDQAVQAGIIDEHLYIYNRTTGHYELTEQFMPGEAHWIYAYKPCKLYWKKP